MNPDPQKSSDSNVAEEPFSFFPPRDVDPAFEGREPHEFAKSDPLARQFPTERQIALFLFVASLGLYLASMSWTAFPGIPIRALMMQLRLEPEPSTLDMLWGFIARRCVRLPGLAVAGWMGLFSAVCGAACVSLTGRLMVRVGYLIRNEPGAESFEREARARRLSGLVAGLYLACCIPFWVAATRSLPETFHLLLLLLAVWYFSEYQHWGKFRHLGLLALVYGIGITEFATFYLFLPVAIVLVAREMFRWKSLGSWRAQVVLWGGLLVGLSLYFFDVHLLYRSGAPLGLYASRSAAWAQMVHDQIMLITQVRFSAGFPVLMFLSLVPWLTLFAMSRRSPWFYESGQVIVRLIFIAGLLCVLYNASFSPWQLLGMNYLAVTPYLLLAVCTGYVAGEFWILGEVQEMVDIFTSKRRLRRLSSVFALALPILVVASGFFNWRTVNGRYGKVVEDAALQILDRMEDRDIIFSSGMMDDFLRLAVWERHIPVRVISAARATSPTYLRLLAGQFADPELRRALWQGDLGKFMELLLMSESGPGRVVIIDMPDVFRPYGYLVPDGFLYRLEASADRVDLPALVESQKSFWAGMEKLEATSVPESNLARPYLDLLRLQASKVANNLGVMLAEHAEKERALAVFRAARQIYPENISAVLNLLEIGRDQELPEEAELEAAFADWREKSKGEHWVLAVRYGYIWDTQAWVRRGFVWALSGKPASVEAVLRNPGQVEDEGNSLAQWLDQAYLVWGQPDRADIYYSGLLMQNERDTAALLELCRLALRRNDPESAEAYMKEALAMGLPEDKLLFDQAMVAYVRGDKETGRTSLEKLARLTPGDARVWMALVLLTTPQDPLNELAIKTLRLHRGAGLVARLVLASVFMSREQWDLAQAELERAVQIDSKNLQAWEMMGTLASATGNQALMQASLRALVTRDPNHYLQFQDRGIELYQQGKVAAAEVEFRKGLKQKRDAKLLNNLAHVIMIQGENLQEALELVNEALRRDANQTGFLSTRAAIYLKLGRFNEARMDLQESLKKRGKNEDLLFMLAQSYEGLGDRERALKVALDLVRQPGKLSAEQKQQVQEMLIRLR